MNYIFHHNDPDGYFSGALFMLKYDKEDLTFIEMCHPDLPNHSDITMEDTVYIVDYNPGSIENLKDLCSRAKEVICIDHHISSYRKFKDEYYINFKYIYNNNKTAACEQVAEYLHFTEIDGINLPIIKYVSDYDCWKHEYAESIHVFYGTLSVTCPEQAFEYFYKDINEIKMNGKSIFEYILYNAVKLKGFDGRIIRADRDYTILIKNTHLKGAFLFTEKEKEDYDFVCIINFKDGITDVQGSIYSDKFDCSELVTHYNIGGGHVGASGFNCSLSTFKLLFIGSNHA